jgi:transcriptional regulator with XRE-family HTH domain
MSYEIFEKLCRMKSVSPSAVSKSTGVSKSTLSAWKKGDYTPKTDKLEKIADYFGVPLEYLKSGTMPTGEGYYLDPEVAEIAQAVFDNPDIRVLFDAARDSKPKDIQMAVDMLMRFKETNPDG